MGVCLIPLVAVRGYCKSRGPSLTSACTPNHSERVQYQPIPFSELRGIENNLVCIASGGVHREAPRFVIHAILTAFAHGREEERIAVTQSRLITLCHGRISFSLSSHKTCHERNALTFTIDQMLLRFLGIAEKTLDAGIETRR